MALDFQKVYLQRLQDGNAAPDAITSLGEIVHDAQWNDSRYMSLCWPHLSRIQATLQVCPSLPQSACGVHGTVPLELKRLKQASAMFLPLSHGNRRGGIKHAERCVTATATNVLLCTTSVRMQRTEQGAESAPAESRKIIPSAPLPALVHVPAVLAKAISGTQDPMQQRLQHAFLELYSNAQNKVHDCMLPEVRQALAGSHAIMHRSAYDCMAKYSIDVEASESCWHMSRSASRIWLSTYRTLL